MQHLAPFLVLLGLAVACTPDSSTTTTEPSTSTTTPTTSSTTSAPPPTTSSTTTTDTTTSGTTGEPKAGPGEPCFRDADCAQSPTIVAYCEFIDGSCNGFGLCDQEPDGCGEP